MTSGWVPTGYQSLEFLLTALKEAYWTDIPGMTEMGGDAGLPSSTRSLREAEIWSCLRRLLVQGRYQTSLLDNDGDIHPIPPERWRGDALAECDRWGGSRSDRARGEAKVKLTIKGRERAGWVLIRAKDLNFIYAAAPWRVPGAPFRNAPLPASRPTPANLAPAPKARKTATQSVRAKVVLEELYPDGMPPQSRISNKSLVKQVREKFEESGVLPRDIPGDTTILRAAGRKK